MFPVAKLIDTREEKEVQEVEYLQDGKGAHMDR